MQHIKGKNVLITGGAGFIGSHLTDELLKRGCHVTVIDNLVNGSVRNLSNANSYPSFKFIQCDILDFERMKKEVSGIDAIYHLACLGVRHSLRNPIENHKVNAEGTLNILEAARQNKVTKFFYVSSSEVYGETKDFPINENSATCPTTVYGSSKLAGENYTMSYKHFGLDVTVLRIFNNYGPRSHYEGDAGEVIPRSIVYILNNISPIIFGDGLITRDFLYVKDTARALADLLSVDGLTNHLINIGTGVEITMNQLMSELLKAFGKEEIGIKYLAARPADVPRLWVDASKFKSVTRFKPEFSFSEGLKETICYFVELNREKELIKELKMINW